MKISIITVCYNSQDFIKTAIESVMSQTYQDVEYIIVDGASKDDTCTIIEKYTELFHGRLKWISETDKGIYDAMNKGLKMATGEVVGFLNADDVFFKNDVLDKIYLAFLDGSLDISYGDIVYTKSEDINDFVRIWLSGSFSKRSFYYGWMPPHPSVFVRRSVYEKVGGFNASLKCSADYEMMLRLFVKEHLQIKYIPAFFVKMRTGGMSNKTMLHRLHANKEDRMAWKSNGLKPLWITCYLKPIRKIFQFTKAIKYKKV